MTVQSAIAVDAAAVHDFMAKLHARAGEALAGASRPGLLQLVCIHPDLVDVQVFAFEIGQVDLMAEEAIRQAGSGFNVYIEARTVTVSSKGRGKTSATRGVFAFVIDSDADKGRGSNDKIEASLVVETSPGNRHRWLFLDRALSPDEAKPIGAAIRAATGADSATGVLTQPYRVAGTPNYPGRNKRERGRVATITRILSTGRTYSANELRTLFPEQPRPGASRGPRPQGASGRISARAEEILQQQHQNGRASVFHGAAKAAFRDGLTIDDFEDLCHSHPEGPAGKFLEPYDRLRTEIERSWGKIEAHAESVRHGPDRPTYADESAPIEQAREAVVWAILRFLDVADAYQASDKDEADPPVQGLAVSTGTGKTTATAKAVAERILSWRRKGASTKPILYAVPTVRLGTEIEAQFAEHGVVARVFRGRQQPDPADHDQAMCLDLETVEIALQLGASIQTACCKGKAPNGTEALCSHFHSCAYQRQKLGDPDVWVVAHQMLFHDQAAFGDVGMVIVDESFWQAGTIIPKRGLTLDEIGAAVELEKDRDDALDNDRYFHRTRLARALRRQEKGGIGGVNRQHLVAENISADLCTAAIEAEWGVKEGRAIYPGMSRLALRVMAKAAEHARHSRSYVALWRAARELLYADEGTVSGRLILDTREGEDGRVTVAKARGVRAIVKRFRKPTLLLDATLPHPDILRAFYPQIETLPPIEAAMPHARVRQVRDAPVASRKLALDDDGQPNRNLRAIRREILRRYLELGRAPVLVIAQKAVAEWLRTSGMPDGIAVEWFNNVAGLDHYKDVRGLIVIGRTMPKPAAVEALAGALIGIQPQLVERYFQKAVHGVRTRSGARAGIEVDVHPDPVAEACRWQICDGNLMQAIGRGRGVNRTAENRLDIDVIANVVLPLTVDEVVDWEAPNEVVEMLSEGVILDSGADMAVVWPVVWPTADAARKWLSRRGAQGGELAANTVTNPYRDNSYIGFGHSVRVFRYQRAGAKQKWRTGAYDPAVVPDIRKWLETRLGPLAGFNFPESASPAAQPAERPPRLGAADVSPGLAAAYRCVVDRPPAPVTSAPVKAEIVRYDPFAGIRFPPAIEALLSRRKTPETEAGRVRRTEARRDGRTRSDATEREAVAQW